MIDDPGTNTIEESTGGSSYLRLQKLFEDGPMPSTTSDSDESLVQYLSTLPSKGLETKHNEDRAASPLPELIIEVIPRRPTQYYDESEEFYNNLEKEIRRLYRRDFLHIYSNSSSDEENESLSNPETMDVDNNFDETIENDLKRRSLDALDKLSVGEEESENESHSNELLTDSKYNRRSQTITKSEIEECSPSNKTNLPEEFKTKSITEKQTDISDTIGEDKSVYKSRDYESRNGKENDTETCEEESEAEEEQEMEDLAKGDGEDKSVYESRADYEYRNITQVLSLGKEKGTESCEEETEAEEEQETEELAENNGEDKSVYESRVDYESRNSGRVFYLGKIKGTETCEEESEAEEEQEMEDLAKGDGEDKSVYESRADYEYRNITQVLSLGKEKGTESCEEETEAEEEQETEELAENNGEDKSVYESRVDYESRNSGRVFYLGKIKGTETCEEESDAEEEQQKEGLAENSGACSTKCDTSLIPEPDVIRLRRCDRRLSSLSIPSYSQGFEAEIFEHHKKNLSMEVELEVGGKIGMTTMTTLLSENTPEIIIVNSATSTPRSQETVVSRITSSKKYTKRFEPYSSHRCTSSRKQMCNQTQQTSFSEDESDTQSLWRNFFVSTPRFYRLV